MLKPNSNQSFRSSGAAGEARTLEAAKPAGQTQVDFALVGMLGQEMANPLASMDAVLHEMETTKSFTYENLTALRLATRAAKKLTLQAQQIARLAEGRLRQSHESLKLDAVVLSAMQERVSDLSKRGIEIRQRIRSIEVIVDPGLLHSLIGLAFDWAAGLGRKLTVTLEMQNWPQHGLLTFKIARGGVDENAGVGRAESQENLSEDTVGWYLLQQTSQAMGLLTSRTSSPSETVLVIEFSRTVNRLEGLTVVETDSGPESLYGMSKAMAGSRLLLISDDARLQAEVKTICHGTGLLLDSVSNSAQAIRYCEMEPPTLVIIDERMRDQGFEQLHAGLRDGDPSFPFVEVAATPGTLEIGGWTSESMSRLSKDVLQAHLASILATELTKVI